MPFTDPDTCTDEEWDTYLRGTMVTLKDGTSAPLAFVKVGVMALNNLYLNHTLALYECLSRACDPNRDLWPSRMCGWTGAS